MQFQKNTPIYLQIMEDIKSDIVSGRLKRGNQLTSIRDLAIHLQVNPNTIARVYRELEAEGICVTKRGMGTYVTDEEGVLGALRSQYARNKVSDFLEMMRGLGLHRGEIIELIEACDMKGDAHE